MEIRDLVNFNREKTGETIQKGEKIPEGRYIQNVFLCIQNTKGEFLVQRRAKEKNGKYGFVSGHIQTKESSIEAILREMKEEMGIELQRNEIKLMLTKRVDQDFVDIYYLKKDIEMQGLKLQKEEVDFVTWMAGKQIEDLYREGKFLENHRISMRQCMQYVENENER